MFKYICEYRGEKLIPPFRRLQEAKDFLNFFLGPLLTDYETAIINCYGPLGRRTGIILYSIKENGWIKISEGFLSYSSWDSAKKPIRLFAQWLLRTTGIRDRQLVAQQKFIRDYHKKQLTARKEE